MGCLKFNTASVPRAESHELSLHPHPPVYPFREALRSSCDTFPGPIGQGPSVAQTQGPDSATPQKLLCQQPSLSLSASQETGMKHSKLRGLPGKELKCGVNETRARHARGSVPKKLCQRHTQPDHTTPPRRLAPMLTPAAGSAVGWAKFKSCSAHTHTHPPPHPTIVIWHRPLKPCLCLLFHVTDIGVAQGRGTCLVCVKLLFGCPVHRKEK